MCQPQRNHCSSRLLPGNTAYLVGGYLGIQTARVTLEWDDGAWALVGVCCPTVHTLDNFSQVSWMSLRTDGQYIVSMALRIDFSTPWCAARIFLSILRLIAVGIMILSPL